MPMFLTEISRALHGKVTCFSLYVITAFIWLLSQHSLLS